MPLLGLGRELNIVKGGGHGKVFMLLLFLILSPGRTLCLGFFLCPHAHAPTGRLLVNIASRSDRELDKMPTQRKSSAYDIESLSTVDCKSKLLSLLLQQRGENFDLLEIESLINTLEKRYTPVLTLEFYNMAMCGIWTLLFSTNIITSKAHTGGIRLSSEVRQKIQPVGHKGNMTNSVRWELVTLFNCSGTFDVECSYEIKQGSRLLLNLTGHVINLKGRTIPSDIQELVRMLRWSIPSELFDPNGLGVDTTYLDEDCRITRYTGSKTFEGVRNIFVRSDVYDLTSSDRNRTLI